MVLFPNALFLATTFSKSRYKFNFSIELLSKIFKISKQFVFFVQTREKLTHGLLKILEKYAKIVDFSQFS